MFTSLEKKCPSTGKMRKPPVIRHVLVQRTTCHLVGMSERIHLTCFESQSFLHLLECMLPHDNIVNMSKQTLQLIIWLFFEKKKFIPEIEKLAWPKLPMR